MYSRYNTGYMRHDNTHDIIHDDTELKVGCISSAGPGVTGLPPRACVSESQSEEVPNKNPRTQAPGNSHGVFCCHEASRGGRHQATRAAGAALGQSCGCGELRLRFQENSEFPQLCTLLKAHQSIVITELQCRYLLSIYCLRCREL